MGTDTAQLEKTLREKWKDKTLRNGKLRERFVYGAFREEPLLPKQAAIYVAAGTDSVYAEKVMTALKNEKKDLVWMFISDSRKLINALNCDNQEGFLEEVLGRSGTVVALGKLPDYFAKREGQKAVVVCGEKDPEEIATLLDAVGTARVEQDKEKVLIILNSNTTNPGECLRAAFDLSSFMDSEHYDITVLVSGILEEGIDIVRTQSFHPAVRVVTKKGTFVCSAQEYVDVHMCMDMFEQPDATTKQVFETEAVRVAGTAVFDKIICLGDPNKYCYYLAACLNTDKKIRIDIKMSESEKQKARINSGRKRSMAVLQEMGGQFFDKIVTELHRIPYDCIGKPFTENALGVAEYDGHSYCLLEMTPEDAKEKYVQLMPCPNGKGGAIIAYGKSAEAETVIAQFAEAGHTDKTLYIYGGGARRFKAAADDLGIPDRVVPINEADLPSAKYLKSYLALFDAYITAEPEEYNEVGFIMQQLGKPVLLADGSEAKGVSMEDNLTRCRGQLLEQIL